MLDRREGPYGSPDSSRLVVISGRDLWLVPRVDVPLAPATRIFDMPPWMSFYFGGIRWTP